MTPIDLATAAELAERYWNMSGEVRRLPSYLDQNFRIHGEQGDHVLKVAHSSWSRRDLDLENQAMLALAEREPGLCWPPVRRSVDGRHLLTLPVAGETRHVRLLGFVPGITYAQAIEALPPTRRAGLHESLGRAVGRLTRGLQGFEHPAADRSHPWNLMRLPELHDEVAHVDDARLRAVVDAQLRHFCAGLARWRAQLPLAVVHNDANDLNVLVDAADADAGAWRVTSIIDFGDLCTSFRLADLAIACTYAMQHEDEPLVCARRIVRGYLAECPLHRDELMQLHAFILARLCQSILMATRARREQPDNDFVLVSQRGVRTLLHTLAGIAPDAIVAPFLESCHE